MLVTMRMFQTELGQLYPSTESCMDERVKQMVLKRTNNAQNKILWAAGIITSSSCNSKRIVLHSNIFSRTRVK